MKREKFFFLYCLMAVLVFLLVGCGAGGGGGTGGGSNPPTNPPSITNVSPVSVKVGDTVTIDGNNFGSTRAPSTVSINGALVGTYSSWSNTQVKVVVPNLAPANANAPVVVSTSAGSSNAFSITVNPFITSLNPNAGNGGDEVTVTGTSFGSSQGTSRVTFTGTNANIINWSNSAIRAQVPNGINSGNVIVTVAGIASNGVAFTVGQPHIDNLSPTSGQVGSTVTITGTNFGSAQGTSKVAFNGTDTGAATSWMTTQIVVTVPTGATTGNVVVTTGAGASNGVSFTVTEPTYYTAVYKKTLVENNIYYANSVATRFDQGKLTYCITGGNRISTYDSDGTLKGRTSGSYSDFMGSVFKNNFLYTTQSTSSTISKFTFDPATQTIQEPPVKTITWGSQLGNMNIINNLICVSSFATGQCGLFDDNLTTPPNPVYNLGFSVDDMIANADNTTGWATAGDASGRIEQVNLLNGEHSTTSMVIPFSWSADRFESTLFFIPQNPSQIECRKMNGDLIDTISVPNYTMTDITIYYNPLTAKTEAAITAYNIGTGGESLLIYEIVPAP